MAKWEKRFAARPAPRRKTARARELRQHATEAEARAWNLLRNRQMFALKFKRQHPIAGVIVDFYCAELDLVLEIDGGYHTDPDHAAYDAARTAHLEARGLRVIRLRNEDVSGQTLRELLEKLTNRPPLPEGERGQG